MYDYGFGDILDCTNVPGIGHHIVVLGLKDNRLMFYKISSRVYKAFGILSSFLDDCKQRNCRFFERQFRKERAFPHVNQQVPLKDAFFIDISDTNALQQESYVQINQEPELEELSVVEQWRTTAMMHYSDRLSNECAYKFKAHLEVSEHISESYKNPVRQSYNTFKRQISEEQKRNYQKKNNISVFIYSRFQV